MTQGLGLGQGNCALKQRLQPQRIKPFMGVNVTLFIILLSTINNRTVSQQIKGNKT